MITRVIHKLRNGITVVSNVSFFFNLMQKVLSDIIYILETLIMTRKHLELIPSIRQLIRSSKEIFI